MQWGISWLFCNDFWVRPLCIAWSSLLAFALMCVLAVVWGIHMVTACSTAIYWSLMALTQIPFSNLWITEGTLHYVIPRSFPSRSASTCAQASCCFSLGKRHSTLPSFSSLWVPAPGGIPVTWCRSVHKVILCIDSAVGVLKQIMGNNYCVTPGPTWKWKGVCIVLMLFY